MDRSRFMLAVTQNGTHTGVDLHVEVSLVDFRELSSDTNAGEKSETIRSRVVAARGIQTEQFQKEPELDELRHGLPPSPPVLAAQRGEHAMEEMKFSARAHDRILKVARTLADLSCSPEIRARSLDRKLFS